MPCKCCVAHIAVPAVFVSKCCTFSCGMISFRCFRAAQSVDTTQNSVSTNPRDKVCLSLIARLMIIVRPLFLPPSSSIMEGEGGML